MSFVERVESLRAKHAHLDQEVRQETKRPAPNAVLLTQLKREKLRIKEEIDRLQLAS